MQKIKPDHTVVTLRRCRSHSRCRRHRARILECNDVVLQDHTGTDQARNHPPLNTHKHNTQPREPCQASSLCAPYHSLFFKRYHTRNALFKPYILVTPNSYNCCHKYAYRLENSRHQTQK